MKKVSRVVKNTPAADMQEDVGNVKEGTGFANAQRGGTKNN